MEIDFYLLEEATGKVQKVIEQLKTIRDPEIPIDIVELGLIYNISFEKIQTFSRMEKSLYKKISVIF